jgi:hypothetical protein
VSQLPASWKYVARAAPAARIFAGWRRERTSPNFELRSGPNPSFVGFVLCPPGPYDRARSVFLRKDILLSFWLVLLISIGEFHSRRFQHHHSFALVVLDQILPRLPDVSVSPSCTAFKTSQQTKSYWDHKNSADQSSSEKLVVVFNFHSRFKDIAVAR